MRSLVSTLCLSASIGGWLACARARGRFSQGMFRVPVPGHSLGSAHGKHCQAGSWLQEGGARQAGWQGDVPPEQRAWPSDRKCPGWPTRGGTRSSIALRSSASIAKPRGGLGKVKVLEAACEKIQYSQNDSHEIHKIHRREIQHCYVLKIFKPVLKICDQGLRFTLRRY